MQDSGICLSGATDLPLLVTSVPESIFYSCGGIYGRAGSAISDPEYAYGGGTSQGMDDRGTENLGMEQKLWNTGGWKSSQI